jgi:glycosyltransferase involved in cell wall biosynthesis
MLAFVAYLDQAYEIDIYGLAPQDEETRFDSRTRVINSASGGLLQKLKSNQSDGKIKHKFKTLGSIILRRILKNPLASWQKSSLQKLVREHQKAPYDCIISSYAPQETHLLVIAFKKQFPDVPWVADMRDEMSKNPGLPAKLQNELRAVEVEINRYAQAITSVSAPILDDFRKLCPQVSFFEEIRNGFNHDFQRNLSEEESGEKFKLGYFGTFYGERKPAYLFEAIEKLYKSGELQEIEVNIFGAHQNFTVPAALKNKVHLFPPLSYKEAIETMAKQDLNIQIHPRSKQKGVFTGKLFDYISVQKPVLALVDKDDVAAQLIREFECGYVAEFNETDEILAALRSAYQDWKNKAPRYASTEHKNSLHRRHQVEKLNQLIQQLV